MASAKTITVTVKYGTGSTARTIIATLTYGNGSTLKLTLTQASASPATPGTTVAPVKIGDLWVAGTNVSTTSKVFESTATAYGGYYSWADAASACPTGWRLPTATEWYTIFGSVANGTAWGSVSGWSWTAVSGVNGASHTSGLFLPAAGYKNSSGTLNDEGSRGDYWSSTECSGATSSAHYLSFYSSYVNPQNGTSKSLRFTVRCVQ